MPDPILNVFVDSNVFISQGNPPNTPLVQRLRELQNAGVIRIVTTDLTMMEIAKKFAQNDFDNIKEFVRPHIQKAINKVAKIEVPQNNKDELFNHLVKREYKEVLAFHQSLRAEILNIDAVKPSTVFENYTLKQGVFSETAKKDQFPDAFIVECLKLEIQEGGSIVIVSKDGDFDEEIKATSQMSKKGSLEDLFEAVVSAQIDDEDIEIWVDDIDDELIAEFTGELNNWSIESIDTPDGFVEHAEASKVEMIEFLGYAPLTKGGKALILGKANVTAVLDIQHPNWNEAMYDSEDKVLIPFENVTGEIETEMTISFAMSVSVKKRKLSAIQDVQFIDETEFIYIDFYPPDMYQ